jgi:hypothetical protein
MTVPHNECTAFNCVLCHAWAPKDTRPQSIKRGWKRNLQGFANDSIEENESITMLTMDGLLNSIQPDQEAGVPLVVLPDTAQGLVVHCLGYNEANLVHQLEAKAIKPNAILDLQEWLALTPYMMLDAEGKFSYEKRGYLSGKIDYETTRFFLEIWHGYYGVNNALQLRLNAIRIESNLKIVLPQNERRALEFLHEIITSQSERITVEGNGSLTVRGDSGLHWHIIPGKNKIPVVRGKEINRTICIQPAGATICPSADYPALYAMSMINDIVTSWRVGTLSNGLVDERKKAGLGVRVPRLSTLDQGGQSFQRIFG